MFCNSYILMIDNLLRKAYVWDLTLAEMTMTKFKYIKEIRLKSGQTKYAFDPTRNMRDKLGLKYQQFDLPEEALTCAREAAKLYADYKAGMPVMIQTTYKVSDLISAYQQSADWDRLSENSQRSYNSMLRTALEMPFSNSSIFADTDLSAVGPREANAMYNRLRHERSLAVAGHIIKVLRLIWSAGVRLDMCDRNPFQSVRLIAAPARSRLWAHDELMTFVRTADAMGINSMGTLALMAFDLAQRPIDCCNMTWGAYIDGTFQFRQQKTSTSLMIPASPGLITRLDQIECNRNPDEAIILYERTKAPYSDRLRNKVYHRVRDKAGLPDDLNFYDLRRTAATEMGNANCTEDEIRAVTGHVSRQIVSTYVNTTAKMAANAQAKRNNNNYEVQNG